MSKRTANSTWRANRLIVLEGNPLCHWCRRTPATCADHLVEYDAGGSDDLDNLVPACKSCNSRRGAEYVNRKRAAEWQRRWNNI
jgi:5-methylcytosine-specific restriction endonuclease McrA